MTSLICQKDLSGKDSISLVKQGFDKYEKTIINEHIKNIYEEEELKEEFSTKPTNYYNLEMIIAIGYLCNKCRLWC